MAEENQQNQSEGNSNTPHQIDLNTLGQTNPGGVPQTPIQPPANPQQQPVANPSQGQTQPSTPNIPTPQQPASTTPPPIQPNQIPQTPQPSTNLQPTQTPSAGVAPPESSHEKIDQKMEQAIDEATTDTPKKKMNVKKIAIIAGAILVVLIGGYFVYSIFFGGEGEESPSEAMEELSKVVDELEGNSPPSVQSPFDAPTEEEDDIAEDENKSENTPEVETEENENTTENEAEINEEENSNEENNETNENEAPPSLNLGGPGSQNNNDSESEDSGKIAR